MAQGVESIRELVDGLFQLLDMCGVKPEQAECSLLKWCGLRQQGEGILFGQRHAHGVAGHRSQLVHEPGKVERGIALALDRFLGPGNGRKLGATTGEGRSHRARSTKGRTPVQPGLNLEARSKTTNEVLTTVSYHCNYDGSL